MGALEILGLVVIGAGIVFILVKGFKLEKDVKKKVEEDTKNYKK